jgi:sugar lactone lactonase YvrE
MSRDRTIAPSLTVKCYPTSSSPGTATWSSPIPRSGRISQERAPGLPHTPYHGGQLLLTRADGQVTRLAPLTGFPNGLAFHPDGSLIVGPTVEHRLLRFRWGGERLGAPETWREFHQQFGTNGMAFHKDRLYVTASDGDRIAALDLDGRIVD